MIQNHQKIVADEESRISKLNALRNSKKIELAEAEEELQKLNQAYQVEEKQNVMLTRDLTQAQNNTMASTKEQELKAANTQIATKTPLKESSDQKLYELLSNIDETEQTIKNLKTFLEGSTKTLLEIEAEVSSIKTKEQAQIADLEFRINLLSNSLPDNFRTKFASINKKLRFKSPVTFIKNDHCADCFMIISRMQISQVDRGATLETCPQCERILLPSAAS